MISAPNAGGYFFVSDIINTNAGSQPSGNVGTTVDGAVIPEPASLVPLGTALVGVGLLIYRSHASRHTG